MNEPKRRGRPPKAKVEGEVTSPAQAFAERVWASQSASLPTKERLKRVAAALEKQGLSMEGVELP